MVGRSRVSGVRVSGPQSIWDTALLACWYHHLFYWTFSDELGLARSACSFPSPLVPVDPNGSPSRELEETTRASPYHMAEQHPTRPESLQPHTERSSRSGSELPSVEADVYIWRYALLLVYARKEEEDLFQKRTFGINGTGCIHRPDVLPVTQPTVSKHWRKHKARTLPSILASYPPLNSWGKRCCSEHVNAKIRFSVICHEGMHNVYHAVQVEIKKS